MKMKAWRFRLEVIGFGDDPEDAWDNLLLYVLKNPPISERVPERDASLEDGDKHRAEEGS